MRCVFCFFRSFHSSYIGTVAAAGASICRLLHFRFFSVCAFDMWHHSLYPNAFFPSLRVYIVCLSHDIRTISCTFCSHSLTLNCTFESVFRYILGTQTHMHSIRHIHTLATYVHIGRRSAATFCTTRTYSTYMRVVCVCEWVDCMRLICINAEYALVCGCMCMEKR